MDDILKHCIVGNESGYYGDEYTFAYCDLCDPKGRDGAMWSPLKWVLDLKYDNLSIVQIAQKFEEHWKEVHNGRWVLR